MVTESHPAIRRHEIFAIISYNCRGGAFVIEHEHFGREPFAVEPITDRSRAKSGDDDPERADLFAARKRQHGERCQTEQRDRNPKQLFPETHWLWNLPKLFN